jgi:hypothetical protein
MDPRVAAIRADKKVGKGSCTSIDECYDDAEIVEYLDKLKFVTIESAIKWAYDSEGLWLEQGLNQRWGEDSDQQLEMWINWQGNL